MARPTCRAAPQAACGAARAGAGRAGRSWSCRWSVCWCARRGRRCRTRLAEPGALTALRLSLVTATITTGVCLVLGVPIAFLLARTPLPGPAARPGAGHAAAGAAAGGRRRRAVHRVRPAAASSASGSTAGSGTRCRSPRRPWWSRRRSSRMPFLVIAVEGALRGADPRFEEAAATLGASRWTTFRRVTLPLVAPGIGRRRGARAGPGRSASSARRSPSPATSRAVRRPCRSLYTWRWRPIRTRRSC